MDLRQLRYFVTIVESKTLTEASRRLHVVQPALSQRLADLEADLGVQLVIRGRSGLVVTEGGQELYERARMILKQAEAARAAVRERSAAPRGQVSIGLLRSLAPLVGKELFTTLRTELPEVQPDIVVGYSDELLQLLRAGEIDLSLGVHRQSDTVLNGSYLFSESVYLLGHPRFFARSGPVGIRELQGIPLLVRSSRGPIHRVLEAAARRLGFGLEVAGSIEDQATVIELCRSGRMATYVPQSAAQHFIRHSEGLRAEPIDEPALVREVHAYTHSEIPLTGAVSACLEVVSRIVGAHARELPPAAPSP